METFVLEIHHGGQWSNDWDKLSYYYLQNVAERLGYERRCVMWFKIKEFSGLLGYEEILSDHNVENIKTYHFVDKVIKIFMVEYNPPIRALFPKRGKSHSDKEMDEEGRNVNEKEVNEGVESTAFAGLDDYLREPVISSDSVRSFHVGGGSNYVRETFHEDLNFGWDDIVEDGSSAQFLIEKEVQGNVFEKEFEFHGSVSEMEFNFDELSKEASKEEDDSAGDNYVGEGVDAESEDDEDALFGENLTEEDMAEFNVQDVGMEDELHSPEGSNDEGLPRTLRYNKVTGDLATGMIFKGDYTTAKRTTRMGTTPLARLDANVNATSSFLNA